MAAEAYSVLYRRTWEKAYERGHTPLRDMTTREFMQEGRQSTFLVAASGREMVGRGNNGLIPSTADTLTQVTVTLAEKHDLSQKTNYNIFAGQANQREIMQAMGLNTLNREIDRSVIDILATGTQDVGSSATTFNERTVQSAKAILGNNDVQEDGKLYGLLTPAAWEHMLGIDKATSGDYVDRKVLTDSAPQLYRWKGVLWMKHTGLPNVGLATAKCFIWHKSAVGHAMANGVPEAAAGFNQEHDYYWVRHTVYHGAVLLQNEGIAVIPHDDTVLSTVS